MKKNLLLFLLLTTLNFIKIQANSFNTYSMEMNGLSFRIDPRIELFNIIAMQFGHNGMSLHNLEYKRHCLEYFAAFRNHPAPEILKKTWSNGWGVDDPIFFLLHLDRDFKLKDGLHPDIISRGGGREQLQQLASAMRDYAELSGFYQYFNEIKASYYEQILDNTRFHFEQVALIPVMESYYGEKASSYTIVLNLLGAYGNFGTSIPSANGKDLYAVIEPVSNMGTLPGFYPSPQIVDLILHEFTHGFINDHLIPFQPGIQELSHLYPPLQAVMEAQGYHNWSSSFNEHLVRSLTTRLAAELFDPVIADHVYLRLLYARRFQYASSIIPLLKSYERQRKTYPRFKDFLPSLLESFSHSVMPSEPLKFHDQKSVPRPFEFSRDSTTLFVLPTKEADSSEMKKLHQWANDYKKMISPGSRVITDEAALQMDLKGHDLVIFGTPAGNMLLNNLKELLPVLVRQEGIYTNKLIPGTDLQLVLSWPNPFDEDKAVIIYTGQQVRNIRDFHYSPVKDQFHYWVGKNLITLDKGDYQQYFGAWIPPLK